MNQNYDVLETQHVPVKSWTHGVAFEEQAKQQLINIAKERA